MRSRTSEITARRHDLGEAWKYPLAPLVIGAPGGSEASSGIINHQLGRRNLEPLQRDTPIGRRYELEKQGRGGNRRSEESIPENQGLKYEDTETAGRLAAEYQVSRDTVITNSQFVQRLATLKKIREDLLCVRPSRLPRRRRLRSSGSVSRTTVNSNRKPRSTNRAP